MEVANDDISQDKNGVQILQGGIDLHKQHNKHNAACRPATQQEAQVSSL